jgi:cytochrome c-type biogenesis protein CcmE
MSISKKLTLAGLVVASVTVYMAYLGASSSWQYYMTVPECLDHSREMAGQRVRISGTIVTGTLVISPDREEARFSLTEAGRTMSVVCKGPLPDDLLPEKSMDVVVEGRIDDTCAFRGEKLITRCASKYDAKRTEQAAVAEHRAGGTTR